MKLQRGNDVMERMTPENVARDFEGLKGLGDIALGAGLLSAVLVAATLHPWPWGPIAALLVGSLVVTLMSSWSGKRYASTIGSARSRTFTGRSPQEVVGMLVSLPLLLVALGVDLLERWPVLLFPLAWSILLLLVARRSLAHVGLTPVHLGAVLLMAAAALAPLVLPLDSALVRAAIGCGAVGLGFLGTGLTDHRRLMRAVSRPDSQDQR